ncbi:MAG: fibronectin type III domain-containing protein, partial [Pyrinomonadaceae bacterium]|nr:fibronectin type III domain-containing protein [Pyrinomonadaceae bacterium]
IRGLPVPPLEIPAVPTLLETKSVAAISWQGSVGASGYDVERAATSNGPWVVVGANVDDTWVQYRPLFADATAEPGNSYHYRVRAKNGAGSSVPSNIAGPVRVETYTVVDELSDFSRVLSHGGGSGLVTGNARAYKEDGHRVKGGAGSWITYRTPHPLGHVRVLAFMEGSEKNFEFSVSQDGNTFAKVEPKVTRFPTEVNPYGYKLPIQYDLPNLSGIRETRSAPGNHFLKIVFTGDAQISRVEIRFGQ